MGQAITCQAVKRTGGSRLKGPFYFLLHGKNQDWWIMMKENQTIASHRRRPFQNRMGYLQMYWAFCHHMSTCQGKVTDMIFVLRGVLDQMSSLVLYNWGSVVFYFYYVGICVFHDLHSYSRESAVVFGGIGVLMGLLVEAFTFFQNGTVWVPRRQWVSSCTSGFSIHLTEHPIFNSHITLDIHPSQCSSFFSLPPGSPLHTQAAPQRSTHQRT